MDSSPELSHRKNDHIKINISQKVKSSNTTGLEKFRLIHSALPELDFSHIDPSVCIFGKTLSIPLQISAMTGGTKKGVELNRIFAEAAEKHALAIGVGSQRIGVVQPEKMESFRIRKFAPTTLLFANLGAVQLNYGFDISSCRKAVEAIDADALILHLNPLQEVLMDDGDLNFQGLLGKIENVCKELSVPVVVKEVGWGINSAIVTRLFNAGVAAVDIAGTGGTSWSEVEKHRASDPFRIKLAGSFKEWGIPTVDALIEACENNKKRKIFASGGLENGIDIIKCIALGADLCGIARPFLVYASQSSEALDDYISLIKEQVKIAMFAVGAEKMADVTHDKIIKIS